MTFLPGWMILVEFLRLSFETAKRARVESASLIKIGASAGSVVACSRLGRQSPQITPQSIKPRNRRLASYRLTIILSKAFYPKTKFTVAGRRCDRFDLYLFSQKRQYSGYVFTSVVGAFRLFFAPEREDVVQRRRSVAVYGEYKFPCELSLKRIIILRLQFSLDFQTPIRI